MYAAGLLRCMKAKGDIEGNNGRLALVLTQQEYAGSIAVLHPLLVFPSTKILFFMAVL